MTLLDRLLRRRVAEGPPVERPLSCRGLDWNEPAIDAGLHRLEAYRGEWSGFPERPSGSAYGFRNPYFGLADAAVLHSIVRERKPPVVVEVGSGFSSRVTRAALDRNGQGRLVSIDPEPRADVSSVAHEARRVEVQDVPVSFFEALPPDAVLFLDSSHRAGSGSDVNHLLLEVLPALAPGVLVHVHDVFLPDDYPAALNLGPGGWNYTEQHLLHALLVGSSLFRMVWPGRYVFRTRGEALHRLLPEWDHLGLHCSFWLERT